MKHDRWMYLDWQAVVVGLGWDPLSRRLLIFGGGASILGPGRLWAWNGIDWLQLPAVQDPPIRDGEIVSTDAALLLVGTLAIGGGNPAAIDVWSWTDAAWKLA
jgi:hypothetical protein